MTRPPPGVVRRDGDARAVVFERRLEAPPEDVWPALTERERLGRWLTEVTIEPRLGGSVVIDFGAEGRAHGTVLAWEPPRLLEYSWIWDGVHESVVRFALEPDGAGTVLRFEHRAVAPHVAADMGSGWHAYLEALADLVAGRAAGSWSEREQAVRTDYEAQVSALP